MSRDVFENWLTDHPQGCWCIDCIADGRNRPTDVRTIADRLRADGLTVVQTGDETIAVSVRSRAR